MKFSEIMKDLLSEYNMTQTELARKLNIKPSQISEWIKEKANPGYETLKNIASTMNISADYLLGLEDDFGVRCSTATSMSAPYTSEEQQLIEAFRELPADSKKLVLRMVGVSPSTQASKKKA